MSLWDIVGAAIWWVMAGTVGIFCARLWWGGRGN